MIYLLIGHRGVGKTSLLKRIQSYYKSASRKVQTVDLDQEIENRHGRPISDIFKSEGEEYFRELERFQLSDLVRMFSVYQSDVYISLGAGFQLTDELFAELIEDIKILWVRRETDKLGRTFLNRPRLNSETDPFSEYLERFAQREKNYSDWADEVLTLEEGSEELNEAERSYFLDELPRLNAAFTIIDSIESKPGLTLELRDDLLSAEQMKIFCLQSNDVIISFRNEDSLTQTLEIAKGKKTDWPMEFGAAPAALKKSIVSLHSESDLKSAIRKINSTQNFEIKKLAIKVSKWSDLIIGYKWWAEDPQHRSFLPISEDGRWNWYRLWIGARSPVNFIREGYGSAPDQPTLLTWLSTRAYDVEFRKNGFAAILGDPVVHSRTPFEQQEFFAQYKMPVLAIRVAKGEWNEALSVLRELGLKAASVTAPLKEFAFQTCNETSDLARTIGSVNTLLFKNGKWIGENTDLGGFKTLKVNPKVSNVIWGGGGTLEMTKLMVPQAYIYSAQTGGPRQGSKPFPPSGSPDTVIWCVGRSHYTSDGAKWPPSHWRPKRVVDLNYTDDSPGLEYAAQVGAQYISGLEMFHEQARLQREFWSQHLNPTR